LEESAVTGEWLRLFLALPLGIFREELHEILAVLKKEIHGVRWVPPEQIHLTIHFFGNVPRENVKGLCAIMNAVSANTRPVVLNLKGIGVFPDMKRPGVLWAGIENPSGNLEKFVRSVRSEVETLGYEIERRPFIPHATLGRVKSLPPEVPFDKTLSELHLPLPSIIRTIDRFVLYRSEIHPAGAVHEKVSEFPFRQTV